MNDLVVYLENYVKGKEKEDFLKLITEKSKNFSEITGVSPEIIQEVILFDRLGELSIGISIGVIIDDIVNENFLWNSSFFKENMKNKKKKEQESKIEIVDGEFQCKNKKCKSKKCMFFQAQTRSLDEGFTVYIVCTICQSRYSF